MRNHRKVFVISLLFLLVLSIFIYVDFAAAQTNLERISLDAASNAINQAFNNLLDAEKAGVRVTGLLDQLNSATSLLAEAENANRNGDVNVVEAKADAAVTIAQHVTAAAQNAKEEAENSATAHFWLTLVLTVTGIVLLVLVLFIVWRFIKRGYERNLINSYLR